MDMGVELFREFGGRHVVDAFDAAADWVRQDVEEGGDWRRALCGDEDGRDSLGVGFESVRAVGGRNHNESPLADSGGDRCGWGGCGRWIESLFGGEDRWFVVGVGE